MREIKECKSCGNIRPIVNKKYGLCQQCNKERLNKQRGMHEDAVKSTSKRLSRKSNTKVPKHIKMRSERRKREEALYEKNKADKKKWLIENNKYRCFFCNAELDPDDSSIDCHHINGRTGEMLYSFANLSFTHRTCHFSYHRLPADELIKLNWFPSFIHRIKTIAENYHNPVFIELHNTIALRLFKGGIYDKELYFKEIIGK